VHATLYAAPQFDFNQKTTQPTAVMRSMRWADIF